MVHQIIPWNVDPEIFRIGNFAVRWYGLLFASGFVFGYYIMKKIFKNEGLSDATLDRLTVYVAIGTIVGARLGHCFFYSRERLKYFLNAFLIFAFFVFLRINNL